MKTTFDRYTFSARFLPAALVLLPIGFAAAAWFPAQFVGWNVLVGLATAGGLAMVLAQVGRDQGKAKEPVLFTSWGGPPTTLMLRHRDTKLERPTLLRYHKKLSVLVPDCPAPSARAENGNPAAADALYTSWIRFLKEATRDHDKFRVVFAENINYGFRRNLWGMKPAAIFVTVVGIVAALGRMGFVYWRDAEILPVAGVALVFTVFLLVLWLMRFTPAWVRTAADAYAERLLATCDTLESPAAEPAVAEKGKP